MMDGLWKVVLMIVLEVEMGIFAREEMGKRLISVPKDENFKSAVMDEEKREKTAMMDRITGLDVQLAAEVELLQDLRALEEVRPPQLLVRLFVAMDELFLENHAMMVRIMG